MLTSPLFTQPAVIAHRGASCYAPENTLAAFAKAKEFGARWVEFDVMLSQDNKVIVMHDDTLERTTNGSGRVGDYSCAELKKLDAGLWFSAEFMDERIPTLIEVIDLLDKLELCANIEIKPFPGKEILTVEKTLAVLKKHWKKTMPAPLISSFSPLALTTVRKLSPASLIGFLMDEWLADWQKTCDELQAIAVDVNYKVLTLDRVKQIKATGRLVLAYMVNDLARAEELFSWGVDAIFADDLLMMNAFL